MNPQPYCLTASMSRAEPRRLTLAGVATFAYGLIAYASFVGVVLYAIGFLHNLLVPKGIDTGAAGPLVPSLLINSALLMLFVPGVQALVDHHHPRGRRAQHLCALRQRVPRTPVLAVASAP